MQVAHLTAVVMVQAAAEVAHQAAQAEPTQVAATKGKVGQQANPIR